MILIPLNRAIDLLEDRLKDLNKPNLDLKAFKSRLQDDLIGIFGRSSHQYVTSIGLSSYSFNPDGQRKTINELTQTIQGWIDYTKEFDIIQKEKVQISEETNRLKYQALLEKWNDLVPEYNQLLENHEKTIALLDQTLEEVNILKNKLSEKQDVGEIIKILFLGASPISEVRLRIDEELRDIENGLKMATLRDQFVLKSEWAVTPKNLQQAVLDQNPNIIHFSGHGSTKGIALEDSLGNAKLIDNDALGSLFELFSETINCVVLNSCYSESQATEIAKHIPYVIGMKNSVQDKSAISFAVGFYAALGAGKDIPFAFKMGVVAIKLEGVSGSDVPVLLG